MAGPGQGADSLIGTMGLPTCQIVCAATVMETVSAVDAAPWLSVTTRENVRVAPARVAGAVKVGLAAVLDESVTAVPAVWVQA